jgi:putative peptide zinc metalloprotease protein
VAANPAADRPRRRPGLIIHRRQIDDEIFHVVSNPNTNEFLRLGEFEHAIFDLLDGSRDLAEVASAFEKRTGAAIEPPDLADFVDSLRQSGMVETAVFDPAQILEEFRQQERAGRAGQHLVSGTVTMLRFLPFNPDRVLGKMAGAMPWVWSRSAFVLGVALMAAATVASISWWDRLGPAYYQLVSLIFTGSVVEIAGLIAMLYLLEGIVTVVHELAHGLTLKHFGGPVPEMGFVLVYFQFPGAYTDTTACYLLPSRFQRVMVSMAGGWIELIFASAAVFLWWATDPGTVPNDAALILIVMAGPLTLMFNWNPLVPFDGYYMATDIFEAPNLLPRSLGYLGDLLRQRIFGVGPVHPCPPIRLRRIYGIFGSLAWIYQAMWLVFVPVGAYYLFSAIAGDWIGGMLALAITIKFGRYPLRTLLKFVQHVRQEWSGSGRTWSPSLRWSGSAALALGFIACLVPACPVHVHGTALVEPVKLVEVRAPVSGFVSRIPASEGSRVGVGQALVILEDPDLSARLEGTRLERDQVRAETLGDEARGDAASASRGRYRWERLGEEYELLRRRHEALSVVSPAEGIVIGPRLQDRLGTYLNEGEHWCVVATMDPVRVAVEIQEAHLSEVREGSRAVAMSPGFPARRFKGSVTQVAAQGQPKEPDVTVAAATPAPRPITSYLVEVHLENPEGSLRPGMRLDTWLEGPRRSLAGRAARAAWKLFRGKIWW